MYKFTSSLRTALLGLFLTSAITLTSAAQSEIRASNYYSNPTYNTTNPNQAVDSSVETAATLTPLLSGSALRVGFGGTVVQQGQQAKLIVKADGGLLDLSVLSRLHIRTFLSTNDHPNQPVQDVAFTDPSINVGVFTNGTANVVTFKSLQSFDQLELQSATVANVGTNVNVYAVFATVGPLPVQLTSFLGKATPTGAALTWETASEQHN
ncbi:MAG: hypothetical protein EOO61_14030, partial [Hymenobacter sp.]